MIKMSLMNDHIQFGDGVKKISFTDLMEMDEVTLDYVIS